MYSTALLAGLLSVAAASPLQARQTPSYPEVDQSQGFRLVVNVTEPSETYNPDVNGANLTSIHVGAALGLAGIVKGSSGLVFYQNGTAEEADAGNGTTLFDGNTPAPWGLQVNGSLGLVTASVGPGTVKVAPSRFPEEFAYLNPDNYLICNSSLAYYGGEYFPTLNVTGTSDSTPDNCVGIKLLPECADLKDIPEDQEEDNVRDSQCYPDVSSIVWSKYAAPPS